MAARTEFPPIRACIFDMDGLLIDSEDKYTDVTNQILREQGRPNLPWHIKAKLQGRPGPAAGRIFREWAQLSISEDEFMSRQRQLQAEAFKHCKPLPGAELLLHRLSMSRAMQDDRARATSPSSTEKRRMHLALATSSHRGNFELKSKGMKMFDVFPQSQQVLGDDRRIPKGRGKPLPDIYLLALQTINQTIEQQDNGEEPVRPEECLVFEDSVPGVESGRRAGMRVVWVPHQGLLDVYKDRIPDVLAATTGEHDETNLDDTAGQPLAGSPGSVGQPDDGWAERLTSLEDFDYLKYGIDTSDLKFRTESGQEAVPGTTDAELEAMTAQADGKIDENDQSLRAKA